MIGGVARQSRWRPCAPVVRSDLCGDRLPLDDTSIAQNGDPHLRTERQRRLPAKPTATPSCN